MPEMRVGQGYDVHRLVAGRALIIGGVKIPYEHGLEGHSDADVLTHAIMDALLGAAGQRDIGKHFPPDDPAYENADSLVLLGRVVDLLRSKGWPEIVNVDATIIAEQPRMSDHIDTMIEKLSGWTLSR
jgi:2-C-methyl-D-erythritol 2,4-cyclodiphosphate synthase